MSGTEPSPPADWYDDPTVLGQRRYWDGSAWTAQVQTAGVLPPAGQSTGVPNMPYMSDIPVLPGGDGLVPVSNGARLGAYLLDLVLAAVTLLIGWLIWSLIVWSEGTTPAKKLLGLRVVNINTGAPATWGTMALRELVGKFILGAVSGGITWFVSLFTILFGQKRQGIWDMVATTTVVRA